MGNCSTLIYIKLSCSLYELASCEVSLEASVSLFQTNPSNYLSIDSQLMSQYRLINDVSSRDKRAYRMRYNPLIAVHIYS